MRKRCLFFLFLFLVSVCLFSFSMREEGFRVWNFTDKDLILYFELTDYPEEPWYIDMSGINVAVDAAWIFSGVIADPNFFRNPVGIKTGEKTIRVNDHQEIVRYRPFPPFVFDDETGELIIDYYDKLAELSFEEKMRVIYKTLSIRTIEGEYIVRDLDDLFSANIINGSDAYFLEIY